ncbi:MAG TPA: PilN domain-containing protein [Gammaproteobacteria bacterium]|nr:PilN domain-containing protein [Gammaproteobacteria bacterium]
MFGLDLDSPNTPIGVKQYPDGKFELLTPPKNILIETAISLPESEVFSKILIKDTHLSDTEILKELDAYFADFNKPLAIDFQRLEGNKIRVMAATQEKIKQLCEHVPSTIKVCAIDNESYAIARALKKTGAITEKKFGFFYTQGNKIKLSVFENNHLIFYDETESKNHYPQFENIKIIMLENKSYLLALGLALREKTDWNLYPWRAEEAQCVHRRGFIFLAKSMLYSILLYAIAHIALMGLLFSQEKYNQLLEKEFENTSAQSTTIQSQKTQIKTMQTEMLALQKLKQQQLPSLQLLNDLNHAMPDGVFLTQLSLQHNQIQLSGLAVTEDQTNMLMKNLSTINTLAQPTLHNLQPDTSEPPYHFSFSVSATLGENA